jgi:TetR/AcrR family transcriptional repressor of nem operon
VNVKHDRHKVLQTATGLFSEKGYSALGVDEILKHTGMTKGAFYNAFGSKEAFLLETLAIYSDKNTQRLVSKLAPQDGVKAIDQLELFYIEMFDMQDSINHKGCLVNSMMAELSGINPNVTDAINTHFETIVKSLAPTVQDAQNEGDLIDTISADEIAEIFHSSFYGMLNRLKSKGDTASSKNIFRILINAFKK